MRLPRRSANVNRYLPQQPADFRQLASDLESETMELAADPFNADDGYWRAASSRFG